MRKNLYRNGFALMLATFLTVGMSQLFAFSPQCESTYLECDVNCHVTGPAIGTCTDTFGRDWDVFPCDVDNGECWFNPYP